MPMPKRAEVFENLQLDRIAELCECLSETITMTDLEHNDSLMKEILTMTWDAISELIPDAEKIRKVALMVGG